MSYSHHPKVPNFPPSLSKLCSRRVVKASSTVTKLGYLEVSSIRPWCGKKRAVGSKRHMPSRPPTVTAVKMLKNIERSHNTTIAMNIKHQTAMCNEPLRKRTPSSRPMLSADLVGTEEVV